MTADQTFAQWWCALLDGRGLSVRQAADLITAAGAPVHHQSVHAWRNGALPRGTRRRRAIERGLRLDAQQRAEMRRLLEQDEARTLPERQAEVSP